MYLCVTGPFPQEKWLNVVFDLRLQILSLRTTFPTKISFNEASRLTKGVNLKSWGTQPHLHISSSGFQLVFSPGPWLMICK
jgi:hypothetical protein